MSDVIVLMTMNQSDISRKLDTTRASLKSSFSVTLMRSQSLLALKQWSEKDDAEYVEHGYLHEKKSDQVLRLICTCHSVLHSSSMLLSFVVSRLDVKVYLQSEHVRYGIPTAHA